MRAGIGQHMMTGHRQLRPDFPAMWWPGTARACCRRHCTRPGPRLQEAASGVCRMTVWQLQHLLCNLELKDEPGRQSSMFDLS
jgi:hypothetical protein